MRLVDAVVDDPDLHSLSSGGQGRAPERGRADQLRRPVEQRVVRDAGPDARDTAHASEPTELGAGEDDREPVQHNAEAPADGGLRNPRVDSRGKRALSTRQAVKVVPARGGVEQQSVRLCERREGQRSRVGERLREWRLLHGDEHLDVGGVCHRRKGQTEQAADQETPSQADDGTGLVAEIGFERPWLDCPSARMWRSPNPSRPSATTRIRGASREWW